MQIIDAAFARSGSRNGELLTSSFMAAHARRRFDPDARLKILPQPPRIAGTLAGDRLNRRRTSDNGDDDLPELMWIRRSCRSLAEAKPKRKPNGKDHVDGLSMREFVKMFVPPIFSSRECCNAGSSIR